MRVIFAIGATCVLLATSVHAAALAPATADEAALMQIEASQDRSADIWQGRHHYLYDDEYRPPGSDTVGSAPADANACAVQHIRVHRPDGSTVVQQLKRCD